ncbi:MAG: hypothetical protein QMD07_06365, partial [Thermodesulfovibrionales bacterium]|nr:hypothetical protein [Thermodesulfovibrionales bacterium]
FLVTNLGEVEDKQFQLSEFPDYFGERVLKLPVTSLRFVNPPEADCKKRKGFGNELLFDKSKGRHPLC